MPRVAPAAVTTPARRRPGPMRRFVRIVRNGSALLLAVAILGGSGWAVASGRAADWWAGLQADALTLTADMGFSVQEVVVVGRSVTDRTTIWRALEVQRGEPILSFDAGAAHERLAELPWIASVSIARRLPDTLHVALQERVPTALWQQDGVVRLIDAEGIELTQDNLGAFGPLPLVVGFGAETRAADLLSVLDDAPELAERMIAAVWVGNRRWDLRLDNGVTIQLPELDMAAALERLLTIEASDGLVDRDIATIDLRLTDRMVVRLPPIPVLEPEPEITPETDNSIAEETT